VQADDFVQNEQLFVQYVLNCSGKIIWDGSFGTQIIAKLSPLLDKSHPYFLIVNSASAEFLYIDLSSVSIALFVNPLNIRKQMTARCSIGF
jgi:hypothetical protein